MFTVFHTSAELLSVYLFCKLKITFVTVLCTSEHPSHSSQLLFISNVILFGNGLSYSQI